MIRLHVWPQRIGANACFYTVAKLVRLSVALPWKAAPMLGHSLATL